MCNRLLFFTVYRIFKTLSQRIELSHEPFFRKPQSNRRSFLSIYSFTAEQEPDIVLKVIFSDNKTIVWVFDAKYRVDQDGNDDRVPDDAINQMHRYRDALIYLNEDTDLQTSAVKERPVIGAYALYPGWYSDEDRINKKNPYDDSINAVNIGAFPLLPGQNEWLKQFLERNLNPQAKNNVLADMLVNRANVKIPVTGLKYNEDFLNNSLVLTAKIGADRTQEYKDLFKSKKAQFYHIPANGLKIPDGRNVSEIRFFLDITDGRTNLYEITSITGKKRCEITQVQSGALSKSTKTDDYYLFQLSFSRSLKTSIKFDNRKVYNYHELEIYESIKNRMANYDPTKNVSWDDLKNEL